MNQKIKSVQRAKRKHKFVSFGYLNLNGRLKKSMPIRERLLIKKAIVSLGIPYREWVVFINPFYGGWKDEYDAVPQWLDFVVYKERMCAILLSPKRVGGGAKKHELAAHNAKLKWLEHKSIPYLILNRKETTQIYKLRIETFLKKEINNANK